MKFHGVFLACILSAILVGCLLFFSAYLSDYRWIVIVLPVLLVIVREIYERVPGILSHPGRRQTVLAIVPVDDEGETDGEADETDLGSIAGLWTGTARIWPSTPGDVLQILPMTLIISDAERSAKLICTGTNNSGTRIVRAEVLEYDTTTGNVDLGVVVESGNQQRLFDTKLILTPRAMVPADETDQVTVELKRATIITATHSIEN